MSVSSTRSETLAEPEKRSAAQLRPFGPLTREQLAALAAGPHGGLYRALNHARRVSELDALDLVLRKYVPQLRDPILDNEALEAIASDLIVDVLECIRQGRVVL